MGEQTWDGIYDQFAGIESQVFGDAELFPFGRNAAAQTAAVGGARSRSAAPTGQGYAASTRLTQFPGFDLGAGMQDPARKEN